MIFNIGFVLYKPKNDCIDRINDYSKMNIWNQIFVYCNSNVDINRFEKRIILLGNGKNDGLSVPYNCFIHQSDKCDYLCLMDQDSDYSKEEILNLVNFITENSNLLTSVGIIGPRSYASFSKRVNRKKCITYTKYIINSGSFLNLSFFRANGITYDERIFLDGVDYDVCWSIRKKSGKIGIYEDSILYQQLGDDVVGRIASHNELRYFYITSSRKLIYQKNCGFLIGFIISFIKTFSTIAKILIFEKRKFKKIKECLRGQFFRVKR